MADRVNHVLAEVWGCKEVVDCVETKCIELSRKENISKMNDSKQNTKLESFTEEELNEIPVVLLECEDKCFY